MVWISCILEIGTEVVEFAAVKYENREEYEEIQDIVENVLVSGISEVSRKTEGTLAQVSIYTQVSLFLFFWCTAGHAAQLWVNLSVTVTVTQRHRETQNQHINTRACAGTHTHTHTHKDTHAHTART